MKFVCQSSEFARGITIVERAVSTRDAMRALEGILLRAFDDELHLTATDLELSIECRIPVRVEEPGTALLDGKILSQLARKLGGEDVTYTSEDSKLARLESGRSRFSIHTIDADDFPSVPKIEDNDVWRIPQGTLRRMIRHTTFAVATEDSRPFLTGVFVEVEGDAIRFVATDSSRLSLIEGELLSPAQAPASGIVPVKSLQEMMRLTTSDEDSEVELKVTENRVLMQLPGVRLLSRVIEGQFPDYRRVLSSDQPCRFQVDRLELLSALERVSLVARRSTPIVKMSVADNKLSLSSDEAEVGNAFEELAIVQQGADQETSYQARYLVDVLRAMDGERVEMALGEGLKQGSLRAVDDPSFTYIVMPVRVG